MSKHLIKDDINYLEYPNWVVDRKTKVLRLVLEKSHGKYEMVSPEGLPTHYDKIVLYFLLMNLFNQDNSSKVELTTTRYEVIKGTLSK